MKIYTRISGTWADDVQVTSTESFEYSGPVASLKGEGHAEDQLKLQNQLQQQAFDLEKQRQATVGAAVAPYLTTQGQGYTPEQLAAMKSLLLNQLSLGYNSAAKNTMTALARRGSISSTNPVGGDFTRGIAGLQGAAASDRASGLTSLSVSDANQAILNRMNAANLINGQSATLANNVSSFGAGASSALSEYVRAVNAPGFVNSFTSSLGSSLGKGLGTGFTNQIFPSNQNQGGR